MTRQTPKSKTCICNSCTLELPIEMFYSLGSAIRGRPNRRCRWCISKNFLENQKAIWCRRVLKNAKFRAIKKGIEFDLTKEDLFLPENCPILGFPLNYITSSDRFSSPSLDRIDNKKGYTKNNVVVVSYRANFLKSDANLLELEKIYFFYSNLVANK